MTFKVFKNTVLLFVLVMISCANLSKSEVKDTTNSSDVKKDVKPTLNNDEIRVGANQTELYLPLLKGKRVGVVANQTSVIKKPLKHIKAIYPGFAPNEKLNVNASTFVHLVDSLLSLDVDIKTVFAPEHGFRGTADAGEAIKDGVDIRTNLPIVSLYGKNKKPKLEQLKETEKYKKDVETGIEPVDVMVFDLQDVGVRFYTYISTLHYVMEACAEANIPLIILDRPNPNGHYIDGPVLEMAHESFVGMHPIPVVHGMTIGEYAQMINGEKWLANGVHCDLTIVPIKNYTHDLSYNLPIKPSPNLPNSKAVNLYPSLCFFEGTNVSAGRGTESQFQIFGSPYLKAEVFNYQFTPQPNDGAKYPKHQGELCYGKDLTRTEELKQLNLSWLISAYKNTSNASNFFNDFFVKLAGTKKLQQQIELGLTEGEIKATWVNGLEAFKKKRKKYLIYP